jgi:hypothetical protein
MKHIMMVDIKYTSEDKSEAQIAFEYNGKKHFGVVKCEHK